jgi:hypothetical protein
MQSAIEVIQKVHDHGQRNACDDTFIVPHDFPVGQYLPQGDINILRLAAVPKGMVQVEKQAQLAPGTSRGSRHCIKAEDLEHCKFFAFLDANPLEGPVIVMDAPTTIEHPEHRDYVWPTAVVAIGYQRRLGNKIHRSKD